MSRGSARGAPLARVLVDAVDGPLPTLLLGLTVVTGFVDAVSILRLGRVFVANMTGNVVFIGFALAGARGFSLSDSLLALIGFLVGAMAFGRLSRRRSRDRVDMVLRGVGIEVGLLGAAAALAACSPAPLGAAEKDCCIVLAAVALGIQNALAHALRVSELTTTVLTMTLTSIVTDPAGAGQRVRFVRRVGAVAAMLAGAACGGLIVIHLGIAPALGTAAGIAGLVLVGAIGLRSCGDAWRAVPS